MAGGKHGKKLAGALRRRRIVMAFLIAVLAICLIGFFVISEIDGVSKEFSADVGRQSAEEVSREKKVSVSGTVVEGDDGCVIRLDEKTVFSSGEKDSAEVDVLYFDDGTISNAAAYLDYPVDAKIDVSSIEDEKVYVTLLSIEPRLSRIAMEYGSFAYPARWNDSIDVETGGEPGALEYTFYCADFEERTPLFTISFLSEKGEGILEVIETEDGELFVCASQAKAPEGLSDKELEQYYTMLDDMNYVVQKTEYDEGIERIA